MTLAAFWPRLLQRAQERYDLSIVSSGASNELVERMGIRATAFDVAIPRRPSPWADWSALQRLRALFQSQRFDLVHSQTPKAGLLAMNAARSTGVPLRVHTFTGQVWATRRGAWRHILRSLDRRTAHHASALLADSRAQADFLIREGVVAAERIEVLHHGSICGVDSQRFRPNAALRMKVRREMGASERDTVILFMGRLDREKGVPELLVAFERLAATRPALRLWLVGPDEGAADALQAISPALRARVAHPGATTAPERFMAAADLLALPSHREGFPVTTLEAASCGIPTVASRIYGLADAVIDEVTGLLHEVGSAESLERALGRVVDDEALRERLGRTARERAHRDFDPDTIASALLDFYERHGSMRTTGR